MTIRPLRLGDVLGTSRMYLSLSDDNRRLFHPFPFQQWKVVLILVLMFISQRTPNLIRRLVPKVVFLSLVANDAAAGVPAGFGYLRLTKHLADNKYAAALGLMVSGSYQQQGLGTQLMHSLIRLASQNNVSRLYILVVGGDQKAIEWYQRCDFNMVRERVIRKESWQKLDLVSQGFQTDVEMVYEAARNRVTIVEVPISCDWNTETSHFSIVRDGLKTLKLLAGKLMGDIRGR